MARILVVDDEPHIREFLCTVLMQAGHTVRMAPDGQAGLEQAAAEPPDLVLVDMVMPHLDGIALTERLRAMPATAAVPLLMLTACEGAMDHALSVGVDDFLMKPVDIATLTLRVAALLAARTAMAVGDDLQRALTYVRTLEAHRVTARRA